MNETERDRTTAEDPGAGARLSTGAPNRRLSGVDIARVVAVAGMVMVHFGPNPVPDTTAGRLYDLSHGRASILFALLAGVGVTLLFRRRSAGNPMLGRGRILLRAALLLPIGLWLQSLDHGVLVILQYYALYFVFAAMVVRLPDRWVVAGAVTVIIVGPLIYMAGESARPEWYSDSPSTIGDPATKVVRDLLLAGSYPLVTWAAPLLVGVWVGRRNLSSLYVKSILLGGGLTLAVGSVIVTRLSGFTESARLTQLLTAEPHNQMPLWLTGSIGSALAVLGAMLLLSDALDRAIWPLVAAGQLALSVYVGHLFVLHADSDLLRREDVNAAFVSVGTFMLVTVVLCTLWRLVFARGPVEAVLGAPWWVIENVIVRSVGSQERAGAGRRQP